VRDHIIQCFGLAGSMIRASGTALALLRASYRPCQNYAYTTHKSIGFITAVHTQVNKSHGTNTTYFLFFTAA